MRHQEDDLDFPADDLARLTERLQEWTAPTPNRASTDHLIATLMPYLPGRETWWGRLYKFWAIQMLRVQARIVSRAIWIATALIMALGMLVSLGTVESSLTASDIPFVLLAPVAAALGVALLYGSEPGLEIEQALPISYRMVLVTRLTLVFGFDLILGLVGSLVLSLERSSISLWPLVLAWLVPMTFLSVLTFAISTLSIDPLLGIIGSLMLWAIAVIGRRMPVFIILPDLLAPTSRSWLLAASLVLGGVALVIAGREEHWIQGK